MRTALHRVPLWLLVCMQFALLGVSFVVLYVNGRLPAPFAPVAGGGDILVGASAIPVAWLAYQSATRNRDLLLLWNVVGLTDLIVAVSLGAVSAPGPFRLLFAEPGSALMATLPWLLIPGFLVPLLTAVHLAIFIRLRGIDPSAAPSNRRRIITKLAVDKGAPTADHASAATIVRPPGETRASHPGY